MSAEIPFRVRALSAAAATVGALLLLGVALLRQAEVVARGQLLEFFASYEVTRVRLAGAELYVDTSGGGQDLITAACLGTLGVILLGAARASRRTAAAPWRTVHAFAAAGGAALYLAGDDVLAVHETIGHNLAFLAGLPLIDHPDDAIVGVYAMALIAFAWSRRDLVAHAPRARRLLAVAAALAGAAVAHDVLPLHLSMVEEMLEVGAAAALLAGGVSLVDAHAGRRARDHVASSATTSNEMPDPRRRSSSAPPIATAVVTWPAVEGRSSWARESADSASIFDVSP